MKRSPELFLQETVHEIKCWFYLGGTRTARYVQSIFATARNAHSLRTVIRVRCVACDAETSATPSRSSMQEALAKGPLTWPKRMCQAGDDTWCAQ